MPSQIIPCADCDAATLRFQDRGFRVLGCEPHPTKSRMCIIRFEPPQSPVLAAMEFPVVEAAGSVDMSPSQARTAQAIINVFETSAVLGRYGMVTVLPHDKGGLTYGRSQTTLASGGLYDLLKRYCQNPGSIFARRISPYLPQLQARDSALDGDRKFHNILRACADDLVMRETQDVFFEDHYWQPALGAARELGVRLPLSVAVIYDSYIHGSWNAIRDRTIGDVGRMNQVGEQVWVEAYIRVRRDWLEHHENPALNPTVYRMDAFSRLIELGQWALELPLVVRDIEISMASLTAMPPDCYDGPPPGSRPLMQQNPLLRGLDIRLVQLALSDIGSDIVADGIYGQGTAACVKELQVARDLPVTGKADVSLISDLLG